MSTILFIGFLSMLFTVWVIATIKRSHDNDTEVHRQLLLEQASTLWPNLDMCAALDCLYKQTLREIKAKYSVSEDTDELQDDLYIIVNERNRIITQEDLRIASNTQKTI